MTNERDGWEVYGIFAMLKVSLQDGRGAGQDSEQVSRRLAGIPGHT